MDVRNIQTFLRVCDLENFTKAAESLSYAQSTVTAQIKQLEEELGFPLFDRIGKKVCLTALGREFLPLAKDMLNIQKRAYALNLSSRDMQGTLCVGTIESLLFSTLVHILPEYEIRFPRIDLQVRNGTRVDLLSWLAQNQLDLVYLTGDESSDSNLQCCYKRDERLIFVASSGHPLAAREHIPLQEVLRCPIIDTERSGYCYGRLKKLAAEHDLSLTHSIVVDNTRAICEILRSGVYLSFLPEYSVAEELEAGTLSELAVEMEPQIFSSQILYPFGKWVPPYMSELIDLIRHFKPDRRLVPSGQRLDESGPPLAAQRHSQR